MRPLDPRLLRHARATRGYILATGVIGAATAAAILVQAALIAHAVAAGFQGGATLADQVPTLWALAAVVALRAGLTWLQDWTAVRAAGAAKAQLRSALTAAAARRGPVWAASQDRAALVNLAVRGIDALDNYFAKYLPQLILVAIVPGLVLLRLLGLDTMATVTVALTLPLIPVFMALVGTATAASMARQRRTLDRLGQHFLDAVQGLPTLKVFGRDRAQGPAIRRITDDYRRATMRTLRSAFLSAFVLELLATLSVALVAVGIGLRLVEGNLDFETGLLVLILAPEAYLPLRMVGLHFHAAAEGVDAATRACDLLDAEADATWAIDADLAAAQPDPAARAAVAAAMSGLRAVEVRGLRIRYPGAAQPVSRAVELRLARGEVVAVVGPSGAGKTSLVHALLGLVRPEAGTIAWVDASGTAHLLTPADAAAWRSQVAWSPQRPRLHGSTLREAVPATGDDQRLAALRTVGLGGFVAEVGLDHGIGPGGSVLSVGERRRVWLAGVLCSSAPVVVLDEPTADLDAESEAAVLAGVRAAADAGRLVLMVAHRPAAVASADRTVVVEPLDGTPGGARSDDDTTDQEVVAHVI